MAVRLLATFPVLDLNGNEVSGDLRVAIWYPGVGLIAHAGSWTYRLTLDGIAVAITSWTNPSGFFGTEWSWWPKINRLVSMNNDGYETQWEPKTLYWQFTHPDDQLLDNVPPTNQIHSRYVKLSDRRLFFNQGSPHGQLLAQYLGPTQFPVVEQDDLFPFTTGNVNPGRHAEDVFFSSTNRGCFYNTKKMAIDSPWYFIDQEGGETLHQLVYAPEFGILVSGHGITPTEELPSSRIIRIWSLEVNPTQLSTIEVVDGEVKAGQVVTYRTRLMGDHSDPAEGEFVDWFLSGVGTLLDVQSKTDADGYATTRVQYGVTESGPSVVTARVVC